MVDDSKPGLTVGAADEDCCTDPGCCPPQAPVVRASRKVGRNEPCPCDSGRKYKKCCGAGR